MLFGSISEKAEVADAHVAIVQDAEQEPRARTKLTILTLITTSRF